MGNFIKKEPKSFGYALEGILFAFKTQVNFRIQFFVGCAASILAYIFGFSKFEWLILLLSISLVLFAELANTAVELLVDLATNEVHPKAKMVKDLSAGLVLLISVFVFVIGLMLFAPYVLMLI
ncbi:diacylglycerol kinase family protein [Candidatus Curtissbacteria bacterium]|nr:diacylglycerol kinase family protein [Candidatus Curtissbacteria bacterium]